MGDNKGLSVGFSAAALGGRRCAGAGRDFRRLGGRRPSGGEQCGASGVGEGDWLAGAHRVVGIPDDQAGVLQSLELGVRDAGAGGGCDGHPAGQQVFVELGAAGDSEQRRLVVRRELLRVVRGGRRGSLDGLQGGEHLPGSGVPCIAGLLQLVHGAVDSREQGVIDVELAAGEAVEEAEVEGDGGLGLGQLAVLVDQVGMWLVEDAAVAVGPQGVDVVAGDGFEAVVERGDRTPGWCRRGFRGHRRGSVGSGGIGGAPCVQRV
ncbi:hypothetical protein ACIA8I_14135 [Streptomyces rishiriensis]|uniref:hypothetical protein n=1 Tax=Streptomyces rishiriensis TaxID=68264 RepID=UPI0037B1D1F9